MACTLFVVVGVMLLAAPATAVSTNLDPIKKVLTMMEDMETKITKAGEAEDKSYKEFFDWCDDSAAELKFAIKTATSSKEKAEALIAKSKATIEAKETEINELAASIAHAEMELKEAGSLRESEAAEFAKAQEEMQLGIHEIDGAIKSIQMMSPALLQQTAKASNLQQMMQTLSTVMDAAAFPSADKSKLLALVQSRESDEDGEFGAPAGATYSDHSGGIADFFGGHEGESRDRAVRCPEGRVECNSQLCHVEAVAQRSDSSRLARHGPREDGQVRSRADAGDRRGRSRHGYKGACDSDQESPDNKHRLHDRGYRSRNLGPRP
eukprot:gnl/TRDRNA2_/TRDRNA2_175735_c14_seq6.p1 gnl/TRDRNA2_/TRDRNA2_175735_c14~~gnl/TRDRNA2_/TRDRNA2_175735_c14_seq6.p1  ORF type:complete len:338 (+),score=66.64 gnl/TRDRNA2_/TRDRNA2_175735_c14_seq6:46-1014(+)